MSGTTVRPLPATRVIVVSAPLAVTGPGTRMRGRASGGRVTG